MEGTMADLKFRYLVMDEDARENQRYYVRIPGQKKVRLRGKPGTKEFTDLYHAVMDGKLSEPRVQRVAEGSFEWLCRTYFNSTQFKAELGAETQKVRRRILEGLCRTIGENPYKWVTTAVIYEWMDLKADVPEAANGLLKALRGLFGFAKARRICLIDPTDGIVRVRTETTGFHTWTVEEVKQFEAFHPIGSKPRLVMAIGLYLGFRRAIIAKVGRQHVHDDLIVLRPGKVRKGVDAKTLHLPILPVLQEVLENTKTGNMTFVTTKTGKPYSAASLGNMFRRWCNDAGLHHCTLHGLRKAGATMAAENGATDRQLMAIFGWSKADMATLYTEQADRKRQAKMGMGTLAPRTADEQEKSQHAINWDKWREKA